MNMRTRCNNPRSKSYKDYGGRGIRVCERWDDFALFFADMGRRPSPVHQIDRINNDGNYEPGNCQWTTREVQARNKRGNRHETIAGVTKTLSDWSREYRMNLNTVLRRIDDMGWPLERALTQPLLTRTEYANPRRGEASVLAKLTEVDVRQIRQSTVSGRRLARLYGVCPATIQNILTGKAWAHVT